MLEHNFDRLSVLSVKAEVSVDEEKEEEEEQGMGGNETRERARRLRARPAIGPRRGSSSSWSVQRPTYIEAVGDARLAWRWVEGWRARLRKGGDVVEKARWEWRLDRQIRELNTLSVAVVEDWEPELVVGGKRGFGC